MKKYYGKILVFGEYTVITGSHALAVPLTDYYGYWKFSASTENIENKQQQLKDFAAFLTGKLSKKLLDGAAFEKDLKDGLYFHSTIPLGYGAGSSGAVCAAVYDRYASKKTTDLNKLREIFIQMENFFHGASSGTDPLVSYLNQPLLIENNGTEKNISIVHFPKRMSPVQFFLIDTGVTRKTAPLVDYFLARYDTDASFAEIISHLAVLNNSAIRYLLNGEKDKLWNALIAISQLQFQHFKKMIPDTIDQLATTTDVQTALIKLCGAGGGGFFLGATTDGTLSHKGIWL